MKNHLMPQTKVLIEPILCSVIDDSSSPTTINVGLDITLHLWEYIDMICGSGGCCFLKIF